MNAQYTSATPLVRHIEPDDFPASHDSAMLEEKLPFTVKLVRSEEDLHKAVRIRHEAYNRHTPAFADKLKSPEATDIQNDVIVLLAESKLDGSPIGTMRLQTNHERPLNLEQSVKLPEWLTQRTLGEATRLGVAGSASGRMVTAALFKAGFHYCLQAGIEWIVVAARSPVDRQYERLMFEEVYPGMGFIPMRHANNMPHRLMFVEISQLEPRWRAANHPMHKFFFRTFHEDLLVAPDLFIGKPAICTQQSAIL
ncbi:MAG: hypothetical protein V7642_4306 [Burkholderiales bacterium]